MFSREMTTMKAPKSFLVRISLLILFKPSFLIISANNGQRSQNNGGPRKVLWHSRAWREDIHISMRNCKMWCLYKGKWKETVRTSFIVHGTFNDLPLLIYYFALISNRKTKEKPKGKNPIDPCNQQICFF